MVPITDRGELVPIDQARLTTWMARKRLAANEVARRAGMSRQRLSLLVNGKVTRCRREDRRQLARVLGVTVAFLGGEDANDKATEPRTDETRTHEGGSKVRDRLEPRRYSEAVALMDDLSRVIPPKSRPSTQTHDEGFRAMWRRKAATYDATTAMDLTALRAFLFGSTEYQPRETEEESEEFLRAVSSVIQAVLRPWTSGKMPEVPAGLADLEAIARVAMGLVFMRMHRPGAIHEIPGIIQELERIGDRIESLNFGRWPTEEEWIAVNRDRMISPAVLNEAARQQRGRTPE